LNSEQIEEGAMPKGSVVKLTITNGTIYPLTNGTDVFKSGRVADESSMPRNIPSGDTVSVVMYEKDSSIFSGCSGYITYGLSTGFLTIAFENPAAGTNKLGCGLSGESELDNMSSHDYKPFDVEFTINSVKFKASCAVLGGDPAYPTVVLTVP
jgi:hypothetical protein